MACASGGAVTLCAVRQLANKCCSYGPSVTPSRFHQMGMCSEDGVGVDGKEGMLLSGLEEITHDEAVSTALAGDSLTAFFAGLFGEDALALETRWLRCKARGEGSAAHSDAFFFPSTEQVTCWVPLGDCPLQRGPLAVCEASHTIDGYDKRTEDELPSGFAAVAESTVWRTAAFAKGDVLVFHARTLHASLINESETFRISSDTRWFPASAKERVVNDPSRVAESK